MLKNYLINNNVSIYSLSKSTQIAYSTLNDICNGKVDIDNCKVSIIKKLSEFFNTTMDEMYKICFNDDNSVYIKRYGIYANIITKNKKYYVSFNYDNNNVVLKVCNVNKNNTDYIKTMAEWVSEDYITEKEMERIYALQLNEKK